jgi:hypothetical protein
MAKSKEDKKQPEIFTSDGNPNSAAVHIFPSKIGDLCVDITSSPKVLYFAGGVNYDDWIAS